MCSHGYQRGNGQYPGASDPRDHGIPGTFQGGQVGLWRGEQPLVLSAAAEVFNRPPSTVTKLGQNPFAQL